MPRLSLFAAALLLAGCARPAPPAPPAPPAADAVPVVHVVSPQRKTLTWEVEQPATVHPFEVTPLVAKLPGYVQSLAKDLGDPVAAGEVLAELAIPELEREADQKAAMAGHAAAEVAQAKAGVAVAAEHAVAAASAVTEAEAGLARAAASVDRWASEVRRVESLVGQKVLDAQTLDETRNQLKSAAAGRDEAAARVASSRSAVREAEARKGRAAADETAADAQVRQAAADQKRVAALLDYRHVRAPYAGFVTGRHVHTGHFLAAAGGRPEPLFTVARLDVVRVVADVPEAAAAQAVPGAKAVVRVPALANREFAVPVTRTARVLDAGSRTLRTEIDLPNPDGLLKPGMYAVVRVTASAPGALVVPPAAVLFADETAYCFAVDAGKVVKLRVQVGRADAAGVQLVGQRRAGVNAGEFRPLTGTERVVVGNLGALADGQAVTVKD